MDVIEAMARGIVENMVYKVSKREARCFTQAALTAAREAGFVIVEQSAIDAAEKRGRAKALREAEIAVHNALIVFADGREVKPESMYAAAILAVRAVKLEKTDV